MIEKFRHINFKNATLALIGMCNDVITEFSNAGYKLTLRQLYYQLVASDVIPNSQQSYDRLGNIVNDARLGGLIDWAAIEDRTRNLRGVATWDNPDAIVSESAYKYRIDKWKDQDYRIEVWIEKDALAGVFSRVASRLQVDYFSCRGYTSQSEMYDASKRLLSYQDNGQTPIILHFGDHDPSGIDMTRDIRERLEMFMDYSIEVDRLALNIDQVRQYNPPPNPAKSTDSRFGGYTRIYGYESWELDALKPDVLAALVEEAVIKFRDETKWQAAVTREAEERQNLREIANRFGEVAVFISGSEETVEAILAILPEHITYDWGDEELHIHCDNCGDGDNIDVDTEKGKMIEYVKNFRSDHKDC